MKRLLKVLLYLGLVAGLTVAITFKNIPKENLQKGNNLTMVEKQKKQHELFAKGKEAILKEYPELSKLEQKTIQTEDKITYNKRAYFFAYDIESIDDEYAYNDAKNMPSEKSVVIVLQDGFSKEKMPFYLDLVSNTNKLYLTMYDSNNKEVGKFICSGSISTTDPDLPVLATFEIPKDFDYVGLPKGTYKLVSSDKKLLDIEAYYEKK